MKVLFEEERLHRVAEYVQSKSRASVAELCNLFQISESTARRDLRELENRGILKRSHGGALYLQAVSFEPTFSEKEDKYKAEKECIAKKAAELIEDGDTLIIDSGTTTQYLGAELSRFRDITVVTNSINLIQRLSAFPNINIVSTGGALRANTMALAGPMAEASLERIRVDKAFIGTNGLNMEAGLTTPNIIEASIKQKMIGVSDQVYIMADHSKIGRVSFAKFGNITDINACITGDAISKELKAELERNSVKLYLVNTDS